MVSINPRISVVKSQSNKRVPRRPQHTFQVRHRPYQIQPFMIAPVIAGETMTNMLMQSRVVTDPIKNPLIGWWVEYYFFYVRLRDLKQRSLIETMLLDQTADVSALNDATAAPRYYHHSGINYTKMALEVVTEEYFRDGDDPWNHATLDGLPLAKITGDNWLDSVYSETELPDISVEDPTGGLVDEYDERYRAWLQMKELKLMDMTFDEYLESFGVRLNAQKENKPELVRFVREWSYPSNTVDPTTGAPSSAVSWSVAERGDKDRFFSEPGFLVGVTVARPKVYMAGQRESASHILTDALSWLPAVMSDDPSTSMKRFLEDTGPLGTVHTEEPYWVDVRDLLMYGDQYVNFSLTSTDAGLVALPKPTHALSKYASAADIDALFVTPAEKNLIRQDGIVNLTILGRQVDHT